MLGPTGLEHMLLSPSQNCPPSSLAGLPGGVPGPVSPQGFGGSWWAQALGAGHACPSLGGKGARTHLGDISSPLQPGSLYSFFPMLTPQP